MIGNPKLTKLADKAFLRLIREWVDSEAKLYKNSRIKVLGKVYDLNEVDTVPKLNKLISTSVLSEAKAWD